MQTIEKHIMDVYAEIKKEFPGLHNISFAVNYYPHSGEVGIMGYLHVGTECFAFDSITKMQDYIKKTKERRSENEILFRRF